MNVWRRGPLSRNPYYHTAFRLARVPRETTDRTLIVELVSQTRQLAEAVPDAHSIRGKPVADSEINRAELVLLDPRQRILEELLEHPESLPAASPWEALGREALEMMEAGGSTPLKLTNPKPFARWISQCYGRSLCAPADAGLLFGAAELELPPPWGRPGTR